MLWALPRLLPTPDPCSTTSTGFWENIIPEIQAYLVRLTAWALQGVWPQRQWPPGIWPEVASGENQQPEAAEWTDARSQRVHWAYCLLADPGVSGFVFSWITSSAVFVFLSSPGFIWEGPRPFCEYSSSLRSESFLEPDCSCEPVPLGTVLAFGLIPFQNWKVSLGTVWAFSLIPFGAMLFLLKLCCLGIFLFTLEKNL